MCCRARVAPQRPSGERAGFSPGLPFPKAAAGRSSAGQTHGPYSVLGPNTAVRGKQTVRGVVLLTSLQRASPQGILTMLYTSQLVCQWISLRALPIVELFILSLFCVQLNCAALLTDHEAGLHPPTGHTVFHCGIVMNEDIMTATQLWRIFKYVFRYHVYPVTVQVTG